MRLLVCGGRDYQNSRYVYDILDAYHKQYLINVIIEGDARGVDRMAGYWAKKNKIDLLLFPAEWEKYGKRAGYLRNKRMLDEGKPDLVIAFPGGKGTAMMIKLATEAGVKVSTFGESISS